MLPTIYIQYTNYVSSIMAHFRNLGYELK